jgi:hypothetical protein
MKPMTCDSKNLSLNRSCQIMLQVVRTYIMLDLMSSNRRLAIIAVLAKTAFVCAIAAGVGGARASLLDQLKSDSCVIGWEEPLIPAADVGIWRVQLPMLVSHIMQGTAARLRESGIVVFKAQSEEDVLRLAKERNCGWLLTLTASGRGGMASLTAVVTLRQLPPASVLLQDQVVRLAPPMFALSRRHDPLPLILDLSVEGRNYADELVNTARGKGGAK